MLDIHMMVNRDLLTYRQPKFHEMNGLLVYYCTFCIIGEKHSSQPKDSAFSLLGVMVGWKAI